MEKLFAFAGITFRICGPDAQMYQDDPVLARFAVADRKADYTCRFQLLQQLDAPEGSCVFQNETMCIYESGDAQIRYQGSVREGLSGAYLRIHRRGENSSVQVLRRVMSDNISSRVVLNSLETEHRIAQRGGFLLHASFICHNGEAILFTAPSGTGKSTQAELWRCLRNAEQINGDRAAVVISENEIRACGVPYSGSSGICENVSVPLKAMVYLSQAPKTEITRLRGMKAFRSIWEGCSVNVWNRQDMDLCSQKVMDAVSRVPVFHLACTPDESAVTALERALEERK